MNGRRGQYGKEATLGLTLLLALSVPAVGASTGTLVVSVTTSFVGLPNEPLPGVIVTASSSSEMGSGDYGLQSAVTNAAGIAVLPALPSGGYWVNTALEGFRARTYFVPIHANFTRRIAVDLDPGIPDCTLFEFWDFRTLLDPAVPQTATIEPMASSPP